MNLGRMQSTLSATVLVTRGANSEVLWSPQPTPSKVRKEKKEREREGKKEEEKKRKTPERQPTKKGILYFNYEY